MKGNSLQSSVYVEHRRVFLWLPKILIGLHSYTQHPNRHRKRPLPKWQNTIAVIKHHAASKLLCAGCFEFGQPFEVRGGDGRRSLHFGTYQSSALLYHDIDFHFIVVAIVKKLAVAVGPVSILRSSV